MGSGGTRCSRGGLRPPARLGCVSTGTGGGVGGGGEGNGAISNNSFCHSSIHAQLWCCTLPDKMPADCGLF